MPIGYVPGVGERDIDKVIRSVRNLHEFLVHPTLDSYFDLGEIAAPANPDANYARVYAKESAGTTKLYFRDSAGNETALGQATLTIANATDYEEGSWTPTVAGLTTAGTNTYDVQVGRYIKLGKFVWAAGRVRMIAKDAAMAGNIVMAGLPYTISNVTNGQGAITISSFNAVNLSAGYTQLGGQTLPNTTQLALVENGDNIGAQNVAAAAIAATTQLIASVVYRTG